MRVLVDTNIVMDALSGREPFFEDSYRVITLCSDNKAEGCLAAHTITNLFYLLRKQFSDETRRELLLGLFNIFYIEHIDAMKIKEALRHSDFRDFEDCLQAECAKAVFADYIVTRNIKDFKASKIPCLTPGEFCSMFAGGYYPHG